MFPKFYIPLFLLFWSCNTGQSQEDYLPKPLMAEVLAEMELAQASYKFKTDVEKFDINFMFAEIYKKNNITKQNFNTSLKFYSTSPKEMDEIYNEVIVLLVSKQADFSR